jgi:hypothetical protein
LRSRRLKGFDSLADFRGEVVEGGQTRIKPSAILISMNRFENMPVEQIQEPKVPENIADVFEAMQDSADNKFAAFNFSLEALLRETPSARDRAGIITEAMEGLVSLVNRGELAESSVESFLYSGENGPTVWLPEFIWDLHTGNTPEAERKISESLLSNDKQTVTSAMIALLQIPKGKSRIMKALSGVYDAHATGSTETILFEEALADAKAYRFTAQ